MADTKISALDPLTGPDLAKLDEWPVVDKSDTTSAPSGTNKRMTSEDVSKAFAGGTFQPTPDAGTKNWVMPGMVPASTTGGLSVVNTGGEIVYEPMIITEWCQLDAMGFYLATAGGSEVLRLGVYRADKDWQPTGRVVDAGEASMATTLTKSITGIAAELRPGRYLKARFPSAGAGNLLLFRTHCVSGVWFHNTYNTFIQKISKTGQTYGAFPATGTKWDTMQTTTTENALLCGLFCQLS